MPGNEPLYPSLLRNVSDIKHPKALVGYLGNRQKGYSPEKVLALCEAGKLQINSEIALPDSIIQPGDSIFILRPYKNYSTVFVSETKAIEVMHEDEEIVVINKPSGISLHAGLGEYHHTVLNVLSQQLKLKELYITHRIDKDTSGILVLAKTPESRNSLNQQFKLHTTQRSYQCLVWSKPTAEEGTIETYMGRVPGDDYLIQSNDHGLWGKKAVTHYRLIKSLENCSLIECRLETGRTHQIRIHMQHIGSAIVGDKRYPQSGLHSPYNINRHLLHAVTLGFMHPVKQKAYTFASEIPAEFAEAIEAIK